MILFLLQFLQTPLMHLQSLVKISLPNIPTAINKALSTLVHSSGNQTIDGFTKVTNRRRGNKREIGNIKENTANKTIPATSNSFEALDNNNGRDLEKDKQNNIETTKEPLGETLEQSREIPQKHSSMQPQTNSTSAQSQGMEVEYTEHHGKVSSERMETSQEPQNMEEDLEHIDIGELDILSLEQACKTGNFEKIPDRQVDNLVAVLNKAQK